LLNALGSLLFVIVSLISPNSPYLMTIFMGVSAIGAAMIYPIIFSASIEIFPEIKGTASSTIMAMRALLISVSIGLTSHLYNGHPFSVSMIILCIFICVLGFTLHFLRSNPFENVALKAA
jgi:DHA1 family bicyclomycin/chloramphenicol resistance-like MFS transporter